MVPKIMFVIKQLITDSNGKTIKFIFDTALIISDWKEMMNQFELAQIVTSIKRETPIFQNLIDLCLMMINEYGVFASVISVGDLIS